MTDTRTPASEPDTDQFEDARWAWTLVRAFGYAGGLAHAETVARWRAERTGGTWDRAATRRRFAKVAGLAGSGATDFAEFVREHGDVLFRAERPLGR